MGGSDDGKSSSIKVYVCELLGVRMRQSCGNCN